MNKLTPKQIARAKKALEIKEKGALILAKDVFALEDKVEKIEGSLPNLENVLERIKGDDGADGKNGIDGKDGKSITGPQGPAGKDGVDGLPGPAGMDGEQGLPGEKGDQGEPGIPGAPGKDGSPDTPQEIATKLNTLTKAVDGSVIRGWDDLVMNVRETLARVPQGFNPTMGPSFADLTALRTLISSSSGKPAGSNTQVQYNNNGVFGATSNFTYTEDSINHSLAVTNAGNTMLFKVDSGGGAEIEITGGLGILTLAGPGDGSGELHSSIVRVDGIFSDASNNVGIGTSEASNPLEIDDTSSGTLSTVLIKGVGNGGSATVGQLAWADINTGNVLGLLSDLDGTGYNGAFYIIGDSTHAGFEFADFWAGDRALGGDIRTCGFTVRIHNSTSGQYRIDLFTKNTALGQPLVSTIAATPKGTMFGSGVVGTADGVNPTATIHVTAGGTAAGSAPIKLNTGSLMTSPEAGAIEFNTNLLYHTTTTGTRRKALWGAIQARATAQTGANASVVTYTLPATDGSFVVSANVLVTASTTHSFSVNVAYTDEGNTARTQAMTFSNTAGGITATIANASGAIAYCGLPVHIRAKASTTVTVTTSGTFTSVTYNVEGQITQIA